MSAPAFTPGPWSTGKGYGLHGVEIVGDGGNYFVCGIAHVERDVCDPDGRKTGTRPLARGWANARLIAAAPDLFAALDHIGGLSRALRVGGPDSMDLQELSEALTEAVDTANAAIARVTTEEPHHV
ncbi:hypothetical protein [Lysobacter antibioticus]|uniref:Uncharacterized protein n=1 Tax=Lysobacter antibioticus TaxID=84531 RepID=A0A0S2F7N1_LYSAN|nr:hypothetical protein [Lysobacter antibioticus]ALN79475.1 hypothetical protein LA76x_1318 [Lysobacter antibioticus]